MAGGLPPPSGGAGAARGGAGAPGAGSAPETPHRRYLAFPVRARDRELVVAVADPTDLDAEQALGFASGRNIVNEVASPAAIQEAIDRRYAPDRVLERMVDRVGAKLVDDVRVVEEVAPEAVSSGEVESAPVVKLANLILHDAVSERASDIHLEPGRDGGTVRFRVDGVLRPLDRKSTRLNSSHDQISYAVFCLKKKKTRRRTIPDSTA